MLVELQNIRTSEHVLLIFPVYGMNALASYLTEITLHVNGDKSLCGEIFHNIRRKVVCKQRAEMIYLCIKVS